MGSLRQRCRDSRTVSLKLLCARASLSHCSWTISLLPCICPQLSLQHGCPLTPPPVYEIHFFYIISQRKRFYLFIHILKKTDVVATPQLLWPLQRNRFLQANGYNSKASRPMEVEDIVVFIYFYIFQKTVILSAAGRNR